MLTLQLNLENEHLLSNKIEDIIGNLSEENQQLLIEKVLYNYLTSSVDYTKELFIKEKIQEIREKGLRHYYYKDSFDISIDRAKEMTDEQIQKHDSFKRILVEYKSPKESLFEKIHTQLEKELYNVTVDFVNKNNGLKEIIEKHQQTVTDSFPEIVQSMMASIGYGFMLNVMKQAESGQHAEYGIQSIHNILDRNNIRG